jgi:hypothetical protein
MTRHFSLLLMSMIIPLNLCATKGLFDTGASSAQYIEMQQMQSITHTASHAPLPGDQYQVSYEPLDASQHPYHDLQTATLSRSAMQRILRQPLAGQGLLLVCKVLFPCCFVPEDNTPPSDSGDTL